MSTVLIASQAREFSGLLPLCGGVRRVDLPVQWARAVEFSGRPALLLANGAGCERAAAALRAAPRPEAVVSTGFCGALDPALGIGDIFVATEIEFHGCLLNAKEPGSGRRFAAGRMVTLPRVAQTSSEKAALRSSGAGAVDMESAGLAREAHGMGLPFFCVRAITDLANEDLHNDFNAALRSDGHFDTMHLLRAAASDPCVLLPELFRLGRRSRVAAHTLGAFLADCRF